MINSVTKQSLHSYPIDTPPKWFRWTPAGSTSSGCVRRESRPAEDMQEEPLPDPRAAHPRRTPAPRRATTWTTMCRRSAGGQDRERCAGNGGTR